MIASQPVSSLVWYVAYGSNLSTTRFSCYLRGGRTANLHLKLPAGRYHVEWLNPRTGATEAGGEIMVEAEAIELPTPPYDGDLALAIRGQKS